MSGDNNWILHHSAELNLRRQYRLNPFVFSRKVYAAEICSQKKLIRKENKRVHKEKDRQHNKRERALQKRLDDLSKRPPLSSSSSSSPSGPSSSFCAPSNTSRDVCLMCAWKGHRILNCLYQTFEGGKETLCLFVEGRFLQTRDGRRICTSFNIVGSAGRKPCRHAPTLLHLCSFCMSSEHHAFAFRCRSRPSD